MKNCRLISFFAGILSVPCYLTFSLLAFKRYPLPLSPITNWLSELGNPISNPYGAILYNTGIIATALFLAFFFMGLFVLEIEGKVKQVIILRITQITGGLGSLAMVMSGVFPISGFKTHAFFSTSLYILLSTSFMLVSILLFVSHRAPWWMLIFGVSSAVLVIFTGIYPTIYLLEWITVLVLFACVILVGISLYRLPYGHDIFKDKLPNTP